MWNTFDICNGSSSNTVSATIVRLSDNHINNFIDMWLPILKDSNQEDSHWNWRLKNNIFSDESYEKYALVSNDITQGLMIIVTSNYYSRQQGNKPIVYVDSLATAPWNRPSIQNPPQYKAVGSAMITFAIMRSFELNYDGLIGLHSLPAAEGFYQRLNMHNYGSDPNKQNLNYYELNNEIALQIKQLKYPTSVTQD